MSENSKRKASTEIIPDEIKKEKLDSTIIVEQPPNDAFNVVYVNNSQFMEQTNQISILLIYLF